MAGTYAMSLSQYDGQLHRVTSDRQDHNWEMSPQSLLLIEDTTGIRCPGDTFGGRGEFSFIWGSFAWQGNLLALLSWK